MSTTLNAKAFKSLINQDKEWLMENTPESLERAHIVAVLDDSVKHYSIKVYQISEESQAVSKETISDKGFYDSDNIDETLFDINIFVGGKRMPELESYINRYCLYRTDGEISSITLVFKQVYDVANDDKMCDKLIKKSLVNRVESESVIFVISRLDRFGHIVAQSVLLADTAEMLEASSTFGISEGNKFVLEIPVHFELS